jgi:PAS domain S-box-containing protein
MSKRFVNPALSGSLCLVSLILLIWQLGAPTFAQSPPQVDLTGKTVLILHSFESNIPIFELTDRGLRAALDAGGVGIRNQFFEYLDLARNPSPEYRKHLAELTRLSYGKRRIDIIITLYPEALEFALDEGRTVFSDIPIIALYLPSGFKPKKTSRRIIGHSARLDILGTFEIALKLVPGAKHVYVVTGAHEVDRKYEDEARRNFKKWEGQLEFRYLSDIPLQEILDTVSTAPPETIVLLTGFAADVTGKNYTTREVGERLSQVSKAPVFGLLQVVLGYGIAGGKLVNFEGIGTKAGELALDILRGTRAPENIPAVLDVPSVPMFDWPQVRRWNLSEAALPRGSIVMNKELTFWDFKYYMVGALAFFLAETALIIFLVVQRRRKKVAEEELNQFFNVSLDLLGIANTDGYFLRLNPIWEKTLGYNREELMAKRFLDFVHPDDLDRTQEAISTLAAQQKVFSFENRYRCKDGTYRWLQWSSAPAGKLIYSAARDVTERKQMEEALGERLRFEQLVSHLSARFVNMPPDRVDSEVEDGLRQILKFFQVDRCVLLRTLPGKTSFQITHVASSDDVPPLPAGIELPRSIYPWLYEKLTEKHEVMSISRLDDLPAEANVDRQTCIEMGIRSYVNIPILIGESGDHIINVNSVKSERGWPEELFPRLRLLGEIFVNALERKRAEEESRKSEMILRQNESDLRRLAGRLIYAQEEERSRLARELHDDLAQRLAVFAIDVGRLEQQLMDPPAPVREELREMKNGIVRISQDVHSLSRQLHPSILDDLGLIKAVESECTSFSRREGIEIVFNHENIPRVIPKDISLSLYRIIQEGLTNISKHACAEHISVSLKGTDHDVLLSVQDDGIGFDSAEVREKPGLGFSSIRERARLIHGEFSIQSQPEKGTVITVRAPLTREGE